MFNLSRCVLKKKDIKIVKKWKKCKGRGQKKSCSCSAYIVSLFLYVSTFYECLKFSKIISDYCWFSMILWKMSYENIEIKKLEMPFPRLSLEEETEETYFFVKP